MKFPLYEFTRLSNLSTCHSVSIAVLAAEEEDKHYLRIRQAAGRTLSVKASGRMSAAEAETPFGGTAAPPIRSASTAINCRRRLSRFGVPELGQPFPIPPSSIKRGLPFLHSTS